MALWQFKMWFVPSEFVGNRPFLTKHECEAAAWNTGAKIPDDFRAQISAILPTLKSWHKDLLQFGSQGGDLVEVWLAAGEVESIEARVDGRNLSPMFLRQIFDLARSWGFRLVYQRYRTVLPDDWEGLVRAVCDSPNFKFLQHPKEWLPRLAEEVADNEASS